MWTCEDCGWEWPLVAAPIGAECDHCGGELVFRDTIESIGGSSAYV